jgi:peptidoglycan/xylan/chitin deacetylase (PgdA/CDA1 family)
VIRLDLPPDITAAERWAVETLVDLSRLLRCEGEVAGAVRVGVGEGQGFSAEAGAVRIGRGTLARVVAVAGAGLEQKSEAADKHQRVPAEVNPLVAEGAERSPVVQRLGRELRDRAAKVSGNGVFRAVAPWPNGHRWAAAMTHDLDVVAGWPVFTAARGAELLRKGRVGDLFRVAGAALGAIGQGPVLRALREVLAVEREHGVRSTWFILVGDPSLARWWKGDVTYRLESPATREALDALRAEGHEIGLHGSMETFTDIPAFRRERARLGEVTRTPPLGIRQHFLKMRPGRTQVAMHQAGFTYDATFGFSGRNGFRLGVADVIGAWDEGGQQALPLSLVPLHWMDRALSKYQGVEDPEALVDDGLMLAESVRDAEGLWVGLWHPNLAPALGYPGAPEAFARMIRTLADRKPWIATLSEVVEWRTERRNAFAKRVAADGRVELGGSTLSNFSVTLEDRDGKAVA